MKSFVGGSRAAAVSLVVAVGALGAQAVGCSEDSPAPTKTTTPPKDAGKDSASPADTGTPPADTGAPTPDTGTPDAAPTSATAAATIAAIADAGATGTATFVETTGEVTVTLTVTGPPGPHGVHVHQNGDCGDGGLAAGDHFNPAGDAGAHGHADAAVHHAGDFGNIYLDDAGAGTLTLKTRAISVNPGDTSIVGRAIIVHRNMDDGTKGDAGPGNSGPRIGCGVITKK